MRDYLKRTRLIMSLNKVILIGYIGSDPELSYTPSGVAVCKFSIATSKKKKDGSELTAWHRCTAFGKTGEIINQHMGKGKEIYVEGELQYGQYEKDGVTRYTTGIIVNQIVFLGRKDHGQNQEGNKKITKQDRRDHGSKITDDDIPF